MIKTRTIHWVVPVVALACMVMGQSASADVLTWGSISVNSGPSVYDWQIADWIDEYFEDGDKGDGTVNSDVVMINTACYGGDFEDNFNNATGDGAGGGAFDTVKFTDAGFISAQEAGKPSYYDGFHDDAAGAVKPGNDAQDVYDAGNGGKDARETPQASGSNHDLQGTTSTHILVWAGKPNAKDQADINKIHAAWAGVGGAEVTVLSGNGTGANADGAATQANLKTALEDIGGKMDDGADENFVFFVTDHGNIEKIDTGKPVATGFPATTTINIGLDDFQVWVDDPLNNPTVELFTPDAIFDLNNYVVTVNSNPIGSLATCHFFDNPVFPGGVLMNHFGFYLPDEALLDPFATQIGLTYLGPPSSFVPVFDMMLGSGDIARPEVLLTLLGDANGDGVVSADDFASVQANFGNTGPADGSLPGDANLDGVVSADDFAAIQTHFGDTLEIGTAGVPEPATLCVLGVGALGLIRRGRRS